MPPQIWDRGAAGTQPLNLSVLQRESDPRLPHTLCGGQEIQLIAQGQRAHAGGPDAVAACHMMAFSPL